MVKNVFGETVLHYEYLSTDMQCCCCSEDHECNSYFARAEARPDMERPNVSET